MRKTIFLSTLSILLLQSAQAKTVGFGALQIGQTTVTELMQTLSASKLDTVGIAARQDEYETESGPMKATETVKIAELVKGGDERFPQMIADRNREIIDGYRIFVINHYTVDDISVKNIRAIFYEDKLISLNADYDVRLIDIMRTKYGKPEGSNDKNPIVCTVDGKAQTHENSMMLRYWQEGSGKVTLYHSVKYSTDCKPDDGGFFTLEDEGKVKKYKAKKDAEKAKSYRNY